MSLLDRYEEVVGDTKSSACAAWDHGWPANGSYMSTRRDKGAASPKFWAG